MTEPSRRILLQPEPGDESQGKQRVPAHKKQSSGRIMAAVILDEASGDRYEVEIYNNKGLVLACLAAKDSKRGEVVRMNGAFKVRHFSAPEARK